MKRALLIAIALAASTHVITRGAGQLAPGRNVNLHPGIADQYVGDTYLQRKLEPKVVCSSTNTQHCAAIANDYRLTDPIADVQSGFGETAKLYDKSRQLPSRMAAGSDAWLGLYRTSNQDNWLNGMVPGFPGDDTPLGLQQPWAGLATATDGGLATDGVHFYGVGLFFNRGSHGMIGAFRLTDYNDESKWPIRWDAGYSRNVDMNNSVTTTGQFADLPSIVADPFREGSSGGAGSSECKSRVYIAYTMFSGAPTNNSFIKFVRSLDCGATYSKPAFLQGTFKSNQRVVLAVDPRLGTPRTTGGGTLYAVWRSFTPDQIVMVKSLDYGETWSRPIAITALSGPANLCTYDQPTVGRLDTNNPADETARALSFASPQVDVNGKLHVVWTERVDASGNALPTASCTKQAQPKIVITSSANGGRTFTTRRAVDMGMRCEAGTGTATGPRDVPPLPDGNCPADASQRPSGPQIQPSLSHNAAKILLIFSEGRRGLNTTAPVTSPSYGHFTGRDARMDVRAAQINPATHALISTTQISQYTILANGQIKDRDGATNPAGSKAVSLFSLPHYKGGTIPFKGDHDDIIPGETFIWESPARWATAADVPSARFFAIWGGDTRESRFPGGNLFATSGWSDYQGVSSSCDAGIRLSNNYFAYIGSDLEAIVHQSFKPLNGLQRTWAVTLRNRGFAMKSVTLSLEKKAGVPFASFDQSVEITSITIPRLILPHSSFTFTVFGRAGTELAPAEIAAPIKVLVNDLSTQAAIDAIVRLNPNPVNPAPLAGAAIATSEHHGPRVVGPFVKTYENWNPTPGNPTPGNPTPGNPTPGNPTPGNPTPGNVTAVPTPGNPTAGATGFSDYTDYQYVVAAQDANTLSAYSTFGDIPLDVDDSHIVQMFITRVATVPTLKEDCSALAERQDGQLISIINANSVADLGIPTPGNPTPGNPTPGNPTPGNPTLLTPTPGNPTPGNPTPGNTTLGNNTFALSPASTPQTAGLPSTYRMTAIASAVRTAVSDLASDIAADGTAVASPDPDYAIVTFRFYHCEASPCGDKRPETQETVPRSCSNADGSCTASDAASSLIGVVTIPGAGDNDGGTITPPSPVGTGRPVIMTTTLPDAVEGSPYSEALSAVGGVTPYTWSVVAGSGSLPPGLSLNTTSGQISGTPTACVTTTYPFTARVTDSGGQFDTQNLSIRVTGVNCDIAVWADGAASAGTNGIVQFIDAMPGFTATLVTTANLEAPGFLNNFNALYVTRVNDSFGTGLSSTAAANVSAFVGGGPVVLFLNDWNDNLPQSAVGDPADANTSQLIQNAIMLAASEHGYVGEFNGAAMAFASNANEFQPLNLMAGFAGTTQPVECSPVTITSDVIQGTVATNFTPTDLTCFSSLVTGVAPGNVWAIYDDLGGRPAVVGRRALPPIIVE